MRQVKIYKEIATTSLWPISQRQKKDLSPEAFTRMALEPYLIKPARFSKALASGA